MNADAAEPLLPSGTDVPFGQIGTTLPRPSTGESDAPARTLTATVVVIGTTAKLHEASRALEQLTGAGGVRAVLISVGGNASPRVRVAGQAIAIESLRSEYLNNAVGALRLSSLPTMVWWRGDAPEVLDGLAVLADRLVLDNDDPASVWAGAARLFEETALSDLRWTRLTRWRTLMASFFDIPEVRTAAPGFTRLTIEGSDRHAARLYAAWLSSSLQWNGRVSIELRDAPGGAPIESVHLGDGRQGLSMRLAARGTCVETSVQVSGHAGATRMVLLGDHGLAALVAEELRVRSRDLAFEHALAAIEGAS